MGIEAAEIREACNRVGTARRAGEADEMRGSL